MLSVFDALIVWVFYRQVDIWATGLYLVSPLAILLTGYHSQLDGIAVALGLLAMHFYRRRPLLSAVLLAASLGVKQILLFFPLSILFSGGAGERLFTFLRDPAPQWKSLRTTNAIERLHGEFKCRIKTQCALPNPETAVMLFWALMASGQITMRRVDGWQTLDQAPVEKPFDLAG